MVLQGERRESSLPFWICQTVALEEIFGESGDLGLSERIVYRSWKLTWRLRGQSIAKGSWNPVRQFPSPQY